MTDKSRVNEVVDLIGRETDRKKFLALVIELNDLVRQLKIDEVFGGQKKGPSIQ